MDIRELQKKLGITMIFVTHDQEEAMILSDKVFVMSEGEIVRKSTTRRTIFPTEKQICGKFYWKL